MSININYRKNLKGQWLKPVTPIDGYHLDPRHEFRRNNISTSSALIINGAGKSSVIKKAIDRVKYVNANRSAFDGFYSDITGKELAKLLLKNKLTPEFIFEDVIGRMAFVNEEGLLDNEAFKKECLRLLNDPENWGIATDDPRINTIINDLQGQYSMHTDGGLDGSMVVFISNEDSTETLIGYTLKNQIGYYDQAVQDDKGNKLAKLFKPKRGAAILMPQQDGVHSNPNFPSKSIPKKLLESNERALLRNVFHFEKIARQAAVNIGHTFNPDAPVTAR